MKHECRYSKAMNQTYPRLCVDCGVPENNTTQLKEEPLNIKDAMLWVLDNIGSGLSRREMKQRIDDYIQWKTSIVELIPSVDIPYLWMI